MIKNCKKSRYFLSVLGGALVFAIAGLGLPKAQSTEDHPIAPSGTKIFGKLPRVDAYVEIFKVRHPYDTINDESERIVPEQRNGVYEAVVQRGWYRFRVDGKGAGGTVAIREGLEKMQVNFDAEGQMSLFETRPAKNIEVTTKNPFDITTYPKEFAERVAKIEQEAKDNKDVVVIGRIVDAQGTPVISWNYMTSLQWGNTYPEGRTPFAGGWFAINNFVRSDARKMIEAGEWHPDWGTTAKLFVYSAANEPAKFEFPIVLGTVYYANIVLDKTPENELVSLSGTVRDGENKSIEGVSVRLSFPHPSISGGNDEGLKQIKTDKEGRFSFEKITPQRYQLLMRKHGYPSQHEVIPLEELEAEHVICYYVPRTVEIEYVFQTDGSRDFTKGNLQPLQTSFVPAQHFSGFRFATGKVVSFSSVADGPADIEFRSEDGELRFWKDYINYEGGFYDAGEISFESLNEADENPDVYSRELKSPVFVKLNHVYVVQTTEGKFAKFVVHKISAHTLP
jgi:protocatechuate 3,4-dioxygenase beta subunit